jgi:hypothetical protein
MDSIIQDFQSLLNHILIWFSDINFFIFVFIAVLHFLYQYKESNYQEFSIILVKIFHLSYLYRYARYTIIALLGIIFYNHFKFIISNRNYVDFEFNNYIFQNVHQNLLQYVILLLVVNYLIYRIFRFKILRYIDSNKIRRKNFLNLYFIKFFIFALVSFGIQYLCIFLFNSLFEVLDCLLIFKGYLPMDTINDLSLNLTYRRGVYLAIMVTFIIIFILFNSIVKQMTRLHSVEDFFIYVFILLIVAFGTYSGFYSIFNYILNLNLFGYSSEWSKNDKLLGNFSVRITSLLLLWSILKFVYRSIFGSKLINHLVLGLFPIDKMESRRKDIGSLTRYTSYYDILYFSQVGFYILNVFIADFLISNTNFGLLTNILFILLPIMVDDFFVIHVYHQKFKYIDKWHQTKLLGFNSLLLISSIVALISDRHFLVLLIYVVLSTLLLIIITNKKGLRQSPGY